MRKSKGDKGLCDEYAQRQRAQNFVMPRRVDDGRRVVNVFVEGYEDVAFWRGIFDHFDNPYLRFEISVPKREDLPKGKKVLMTMIPQSNEELLLCVDSDFDYLFGDSTEQSAQINAAPFMFHTYTSATENYLCYAPSLHNVCVKATKNDAHIFDFEEFMAAYSRTIYPVFLWYVYSAQLSSESVFPLVDFKNVVRLGYLEVENNGADTLAWLERQVQRKLGRLRAEHPAMHRQMDAVAEYLNRPISDFVTDGKLKASVRHAIRLLVGTWYASRESVAFATPSVMPDGVYALLMPLRRFVSEEV